MDRIYMMEAAALNATPPVKYVGMHMGYPLFQQDPPGIGSFMLHVHGGDDLTVAQAFDRAQRRYQWEGK